MTLKEYLIRENISQRTFARTLGISNSTVAAISRGKRPSKKTAKLIEAKTYGKVKASDLLQQEPWKRVALYR
jgi:transcriptional regulator with XRE-family HTH domain